MPDHGAVAGLPVLTMRVGLAMGLFVLGSAALVARIATNGRALPTAAVVVVTSVGFGVWIWQIERRTLEKRLSELDLAPAPAADLRRRALVRGVLISVAAAAAGGSAMFLIGSALGGMQPHDASTGAGLLLGLALSHALGARDLGHWQLANERLLFTNGTRYRFAFTKQQAQGQMVLVALPDHVRDRAGTPR